jgi:hypothetical protein
MYVKTKNGVYEITDKQYDILCGNLTEKEKENYKNVTSFGIGSVKEGTYQSILIKDILNKSEKPEELCDVFVVEDILNDVRYFKDYDDLIEDISYGSLHPTTIVYGAIWVEIKLQNGKTIHKPEPVAILNENGDFELIFKNDN